MIAAVQDDSEEWVTTKKVEIVTTKNIERKVERKVVLEDGRVMEEEIPVVTVDTTEDKKVYQTDQDEERRLLREIRGGECDDKVTSVKNIKDIKENLIKTEAVQSIGNIARKVGLFASIHDLWYTKRLVNGSFSSSLLFLSFKAN